MHLKDFLKDKKIAIILLIFGIITIEILLAPIKLGNFIKIYIPVVILSLYIIGLMIEYIGKRNFYHSLLNTINELEDKYLVSEIIKYPNFVEGKILVDTFKETNKAMIENVNKYKYMQEDYKDFIELWIHEIKLPIATSKLVIENNKNEVTKSIDEELQKIENYTEQALFYARSNTVEKDYYIKKSSLRSIVNESIKKNKNMLIQEKIGINIYDVDLEVYTDSKWIVFILNQVIQNSIKYKKHDTNLKIDIYAKQGKENVILYIKDNGIGIKEIEIARVFDKGFTGTNGRLSNKKSTGIGLYLCKKLCDKLGIGIEVISKDNEGTAVQIIFPQDSYMEQMF